MISPRGNIRRQRSEQAPALNKVRADHHSAGLLWDPALPAALCLPYSRVTSAEMIAGFAVEADLEQVYPGKAAFSRRQAHPVAVSQGRATEESAGYPQL